MPVKQGVESKLTVSIKIDPQVWGDAKEWAAMNNSNFSAMVELLLRTVIDRDRETLEKFKNSPKSSLGDALKVILAGLNEPVKDGKKAQVKSRKPRKAS